MSTLEFPVECLTHHFYTFSLNLGALYGLLFCFALNDNDFVTGRSYLCDFEIRNQVGSTEVAKTKTIVSPGNAINGKLT